MSQQPSVGRIVHYHPSAINRDGAVAKDPDQDQPNVAIIIYVHSATCVNLYVVNKWGTANSHTSICEGGPDQPGTWSWPPRV